MWDQEEEEEQTDKIREPLTEVREKMIDLRALEPQRYTKILLRWTPSPHKSKQIEAFAP